jgi:hypothetical protein
MIERCINNGGMGTTPYSGVGSYRIIIPEYCGMWKSNLTVEG